MSTRAIGSIRSIGSVLMTADTVGGVWNHAVELAAALGRRGVRVELATMGAPLAADQRAQIGAVPGAAVHESACKLEWMEDPWNDVERAGAWLLDLERALRPDVVHLNQFAFGALDFSAPKLVVAHSCVVSWWQAVRRCRAPDSWDRYRALVANGLAGADLVAAPTAAMLRSLRDNYGWNGRGVVVPNGRSAADYPCAAKEPWIFSAGRLWDEAKNLAALESVAPRLPWPVVVAGPAAHPDGGIRVPQAVRVLGMLSKPAMADACARAAIYAHPARYEPFGLALLEAALAGCALVLGDIPSLREVWGDCALYVPPDDPEVLRETLLRLTADAALRVSFARRARARALTYTPERMVAGYAAAYAHIAAAAAAPPGESLPPLQRGEWEGSSGEPGSTTTEAEPACAS